VSYDYVIDPEEWALAVQVGTELAMGIVMRRTEPVESSNDKICPRCRKDNSQARVIGSWIDCWYCEGRFCVSEVEADLDAHNAEGPSLVQETNGPVMAPHHEADANAADVALFKRIHLVNVTLGVASLPSSCSDDINDFALLCSAYLNMLSRQSEDTADAVAPMSPSDYGAAVQVLIDLLQASPESETVSGDFLTSSMEDSPWDEFLTTPAMG